MPKPLIPFDLSGGPVRSAGLAGYSRSGDDSLPRQLSRGEGANRSTAHKRSTRVSDMLSTTSDVTARQEARAAGRVRYFTGTPCAYGHVAERFTSTGRCLACNNEAQLRWRAAHPRPKKARAELSPEERRARKERRRKQIAAWHAAHRGERCAHANKRRAAKKAQACTCCTDAQIQELYAIAWMVCKHVDHVQPLSMGGSHCLKNLQLLHPDEHAAKTAQERKAIYAYKRSLSRVPPQTRVSEPYPLDVIRLTP